MQGKSVLHSDSLTSKWTIGPRKIILLYKEMAFHFHASESESILPAFRLEASVCKPSEQTT